MAIRVRLRDVREKRGWARTELQVSADAVAREPYGFRPQDAAFEAGRIMLAIAPITDLGSEWTP